MIEFNNDNKLHLLTSLYQQVYKEMRRYRDMEWKILLWTVILLAGVSTTTNITEIKDSHRPYVQTLLYIFIVTVAIYGIWHIISVHRRLTWYRNLRRECDRIFKFFETGIYDTHRNTTILPMSWKDEEVKFSDGRPHLICWFGLIILMALYAIYSVAFYV